MTSKKILRLLFPLCLLSVGPAFSEESASLERPFIWVQNSDKEAILEKIVSEEWAQSLFEALKLRADAAVNQHQENREEYLKGLPLEWHNGKEAPPRFYYIQSDADGTDGGKHRAALSDYLKDSIDCGVMYYLTGETAYAQCAADVLAVSVGALVQMSPSGGSFNGGLVYPNDHLKEARLFGAQFPLIYDFVYPFISRQGTVFDIVSGDDVEFPFEKAQAAFRTYANLALDVGIINSNWPVLESSSLVHNLLALDDPEERASLLPYYLELNTPHQDSLKKVASYYKNPGDMWPESSQYSNHVSQFSVYLMTLLDRIYPDLDLGERYKIISSSLAGMYHLQYPNGDIVAFGDGQRRPKTPYGYYDMAHLLATIHGDEEQLNQFGSLIKTGIQSGEYDRGELEPRNSYPEPYKTPLQLLWRQADLKGSPTVYPLDRTVSLPFAGIHLQRNLAENGDKKDGLMGFVGGGHYVHGHASGMDMELYGKGEVLGVDGGVGKYRTDIHENYYRLFAAHNTVISNGASASKGGWVNLGINQVELVSMEPMPREPALADNYSFSTTRFFDEHNLVSPARHERTLAVVRTSQNTGYYVDIFRAKSDAENPFHDYIYRNIGESIDIHGAAGPLPLGEDDGRFSKSAELPWRQNRSFRHPGWHFFDQIKISEKYDQPIEAVFKAREAGPNGLGMHLFMNGESSRSYASVFSPPVNRLSPLRAYVNKRAPTIVVRQEGNAWEQPFVTVFEPFEAEGDMRSVQSMRTLYADGAFRGLVVQSEVSGKTLQQVILVHEVETEQTYPEWNLRFSGHFAIISFDGKGKLLDAYIGDGKRLQIGDRVIDSMGKSHTVFDHLVE